MIRINLLTHFHLVDSKNFTSDADQKKLLLYAAKKLSICLLGPIALYVYEAKSIPELQQKLNTINSQISEAQQFNNKQHALAEEIKQYKINQTKIDAQVRFLNLITSEKENEFKLLNLIQEAMPNSMWLTQIKIENNEVQIFGSTDQQETVGQFLVRLTNSEFLQNVQLANQERNQDELGIAVPTVRFTLKSEFRAHEGGSGD